MVKSVPGVYRHGKVELLEPLNEPEGTPVVVTLTSAPGPVDLVAVGSTKDKPPVCALVFEPSLTIGTVRTWTPMTRFRRGDVVGTELPQVIVAMITSNLARAGNPSRLLVALASPQGRGTGLLTHSVIMTDNLATILSSEIDRRIGGVSDMSMADRALRHTLGL